MGLLSRLASRAGRSVVRRAGKAANAVDALSNYALITGGLGGLGGMLMNADDVRSRGGDQADIDEAAFYGGRAGAMGGPLAFGPAVAMTAAAGPIGGMPIVPWALYTGMEGTRRFDERRLRRQQEEEARRAIEMQLAQIHRYD